jgi:hypothetical protein
MRRPLCLASPPTALRLLHPLVVRRGAPSHRCVGASRPQRRPDRTPDSRHHACQRDPGGRGTARCCGRQSQAGCAAPRQQPREGMRMNDSLTRAWRTGRRERVRVVARREALASAPCSVMGMRNRRVWPSPGRRSRSVVSSASRAVTTPGAVATCCPTRRPHNTGDKLRASNMLNARQLHPLVRRRRSACRVLVVALSRLRAAAALASVLTMRSTSSVGTGSPNGNRTVPLLTL